MMTTGQAVKDKRTALGRAAAQTGSDFQKRHADAQALVASEGLTLEQAFARVWTQVEFLTV